MKQAIRFIMSSLLFAPLGAQAEIKSLDAILAKATPQETNDLGRLLQQIRIVPAKDPATGKSVFKVMAVEKGSVYEREGVRVGDFLSAGSMGTSGKTMDFKSAVKPNTNAGSKNQ